MLTLTHRYPGQDDACRNGAGWTMLMGQLDAWLTGQAFAPQESWPALRDVMRWNLGRMPYATAHGCRSAAGWLCVSCAVARPVAETWAWLTEKDKLADWLGDVDVELRPGGVFRIRFALVPMVMEGTITAVEQHRKLSLIWREPWFADDDVTRDFMLETREGGTLLTLTHVFPHGYDPHEYLPGWHEFMDAFENAMEGIAFVWDTPERKARYAALGRVYVAIGRAGG